MNREEVTNLLAIVQTYDQRTVGETDVHAWHGTLGDLPFGHCRDAVIQHFKGSTDRLMPAHVRKAVTATRNEAAMRALSPARTDLVPMPDWFKGLYKKSLREARAAGTYGQRGPLSTTTDNLADGW